MKLDLGLVDKKIAISQLRESNRAFITPIGNNEELLRMRR